MIERGATTAWKTIQQLNFAESEIGKDWIFPGKFHETTYSVKAGTGEALVEKFAKACEAGEVINLEFYNPHGLIMTIPIVKVEYLQKESYLQSLLGGFETDVIKVTLALTKEQLWATTPLSEIDHTPFKS